MCYFTKIMQLKTCQLLLSATVIVALANCTQKTTPHLSADIQHRSWMDYGGGADQSKYVVTDKINKSNVKNLKMSWMYSTGDERSYQFNPILIDNVMYVLAKNSSLVAIDFTTGKELWIHANLQGITRRGINYWENKTRTDRRLIFQINNTLQAIDAETGLSITKFGNNGQVDLRQGLGREASTIRRIQSGTPGKIYENTIILGSSTGEGYLSPPGHVRAYNVITGKQEWIFHTIPQPGEYGYDTWPKDAYKYAGGANVWGEISIDKQRGIAYLPIGSPTYDYYGADRLGSNLFGNCLVAIDIKTGKRLWHFQTVHHDLWDYDLTSAPQLITVEHNGEKIDAVIAASKQGFLFAFNRVTGEPLWPIEERPVPASEVPGEQAWPTQPFPTKLPPYARQIMTADDVTTFFITKTEQADWKKRLNNARKGLYLPPSGVETVSLPGAVGGTNWGNTASNPDKGLLFLLNQDFPSFYKLEPQRPVRPNRNLQGKANDESIARGKKAYQSHCQVCHGEDRKGTGSAPSLLELPGFEQVRRSILYGNGRMPAVQHIGENAVSDIYRYLNVGKVPYWVRARAQNNKVTMPEGPVVASGGIPVEKDNSPRQRDNAYPEGSNAPSARYFTDYGLGHPYIMTPPWSQIIAYDLNKGEIKWRKPLGQDLQATKEGGKNTGVPRGAQRNGMVVTSTGIIFSTAKDGHVYAFDENNGDTLWKAALPMGTEGLPSLFIVNDKPYLVVIATTPLTWGLSSRESGYGSKEPRGKGGYVVFALPD